MALISEVGDKMASKPWCVLSSVFLLCLGAVAALAGGHYRFYPAGNFPGASATVPLAVSLVHIVGEYEIPGGVHAYIQTGKSFINAEPSGSLDSYLTGINVHERAVGGYCPQGCNPETGQYGYTYDFKTGKIRTIRFPLKGAATTAYGINDKGTIVGGYCPNSPVCPQGAFNPTHDGFVETGGVFTTLNYPGANATTAFAINNSDIIVGFYTINLTGPHAFLYQNGKFQNIDFHGAGYTLATGINNLGVVAGLFAGSNGVRGFTYYNGTFTEVDEPGTASTAVAGINDHGELVGTSNLTVGAETFKAIPVAGPEEP